MNKKTKKGKYLAFFFMHFVFCLILACFLLIKIFVNFFYFIHTIDIGIGEFELTSSTEIIAFNHLNFKLPTN